MDKMRQQICELEVQMRSYMELQGEFAKVKTLYEQRGKDLDGQRMENTKMEEELNKLRKEREELEEELRKSVE